MNTDTNTERTIELQTRKKIFEGDVWLTAEEINTLHNRTQEQPLLASEWKQCGRVFSIFQDRKEYYALYQFDSSYQPLPIVKEVLNAYGEYTNPWAIAAWFHFPNGWIAVEGPDSKLSLSPKDALDRHADVITAARNRRGTYIA